MNKQQQTAIANSCEFAFQCSQPKYCKIFAKPKHCVSVLLTVNVGEE